MPKARRWAAWYSKQQHYCTPFAWQTDAACTAVFGVLQRLLPPTTCGNPSRSKSRRLSDTSTVNISGNAPHFWVEAVPKMICEKLARICLPGTIFGPRKVDELFCGPRTFVFSFQKHSLRDGLRQRCPKILFVEVGVFGFPMKILADSLFNQSDPN